MSPVASEKLSTVGRIPCAARSGRPSAPEKGARDRANPGGQQDRPRFEKRQFPLPNNEGEGIVNLTRSRRPSWSLSLERGQPYRRAKDFSAPNRRATDGRRIPPLLKLTMPGKLRFWERETQVKRVWQIT